MERIVYKLKLRLPHLWIVALVSMLIMGTACTRKDRESPHTNGDAVATPSEPQKARAKVPAKPKLAIFLDYTASMQGYYKSGNITQNIGSMMSYASSSQTDLEFWKYGQQSPKAVGEVCMQIPTSRTQDVHTFLSDDLFTWYANDYKIAISKMVSLSEADSNKITVLVTDGIPSSANHSRSDGGDHNNMQTNITNSLSRFAGQETTACTIMSLKSDFDGRVFCGDGARVNYSGPKPYFLVFFYRQSQSEFVTGLCNKLEGKLASYDYNNTKQGIFNLKSGSIGHNRGSPLTLRFLAEQNPSGPTIDNFNTGMITAKVVGTNRPLSLQWQKKNLPNNTVIEVSAPVTDNLESLESQKILITYKAPIPFGVLSQGFDSDVSPPADHTLEQTKSRDLNILIDGVYKAFEHKAGAQYSYTAPRNLSK